MIVRTKKSSTIKHASIGVVNTVFYHISDSIVEGGLTDEQNNYLPWFTMDGINDAGVVCNLNVVPQADLGNNKHTETRPGERKINVVNLVRPILDNCGSVAEALEYIYSVNVEAIPGAWDGHLMIGDPTNNVVVEFTGDKIQVTKADIMTNFYVFMYYNTGEYPDFGCGTERYDILKANYESVKTMEDMYELLKMVRYTRSYTTETTPFWCSEFYDKIGKINETPVNAKTPRDQIINHSLVKKQIKEYQNYEENNGRTFDTQSGLWFTTHNTTYDIKNRRMWVTIRERYESRYEFNL